jgi:hypothetical protein
MASSSAEMSARVVLMAAMLLLSARSDQVESPGRKELAQVQWLEHDPQKWFPLLAFML